MINDNDDSDILEFGRPPRRRISPSAGRAIVAVVTLVALAGAIRWATSGSAPAASSVGHAAASSAAGREVTDTPIQPIAGPVLRAGTQYRYGSEDAGPTFWLEFDVMPPSTTLTGVTASVAPMYGLAEGRVFFYRPADATIDVSSGTFGAHASLRTLPAGVGFTAVVIWTPTCTAMPARQPVAIRVRYTTAGAPGVLDLIGAPNVRSEDVGATAAACVHRLH